MNKKPVSYYQNDKRWKDLPYRTKGESSTIGSAGCGPTSAAMLIETIIGKKFTPVDACNWSMAHGYKALNQGTYYTYFKEQFKAFGIDCDMLNWTNTYGKPNHENHKKVLEMLKKGYYFIALMNKGTWTSSGHFIVVWWADDKIRILDPASSRPERVNGDPYDFRSEVKYYWWVDAREHNKESEEDDMDDKRFKEFYDRMVLSLRDNDSSDYSKDAREWAVANGLIKGGDLLPNGEPNYMWEDLLTREQMVTLLYRFYLLMGGK